MKYKCILFILLVTFLVELLDSSSVFVRSTTVTPASHKNELVKGMGLQKPKKPPTSILMTASLNAIPEFPDSEHSEKENDEGVCTSVHTALIFYTIFEFNTPLSHEVFLVSRTLHSTELRNALHRPPIAAV